MSEVRTIRVDRNINACNDTAAGAVRRMMNENGTLFLNIMSAPGSGKTTLLTALINRLKPEFRIGEMDVDICSSLDARRVADQTGIPSLQIHNGGLCHIDADMTLRALLEYDSSDLDVLFLENIGNLVCPAEFDTGAHRNIALLSIPEGDDKPLKYPLMFEVCDAVIITKTDVRAYFDFDLKKAMDAIHRLNPDTHIFTVSARTGEGLDILCDYIRELYSAEGPSRKRIQTPL